MRFASHLCGQASMVVQHWYVANQQPMVFEASGDLEAGAELHFNYFLNVRNIAAKEKQSCSWSGCACGATGCKDSIDNDPESLVDKVRVQNSSAGRNFVMVGAECEHSESLHGLGLDRW